MYSLAYANEIQGNTSTAQRLRNVQRYSTPSKTWNTPLMIRLAEDRAQLTVTWRSDQCMIRRVSPHVWTQSQTSVTVWAPLVEPSLSPETQTRDDSPCHSTFLETQINSVTHCCSQVFQNQLRYFNMQMKNANHFYQLKKRLTAWCWN